MDYSSYDTLYIAILLIVLAVCILMVVAYWKIFEKAGQPGWAVFVPFYGSYVMFKISWKNPWLFLFSVVPTFASGVIDFAVNRIERGLLYSSLDFATLSSLSLFGSVMNLAATVFMIVTYVKLAKAFGKGDGGFACGMIFLTPIFLCILAFSKNIQYVGVDGIAERSPALRDDFCSGNDFRQDGYYDPYRQDSPANDQYRYRRTEPQGGSGGYCPSCGGRVKAENGFCPTCGRKLRDDNQ